MIKLFRNIRKKLLNEGKITNYLKYAIGEIVLVVIGILIALQINNWNEKQKLRRTEFKLLTELRSDLLLTHTSTKKILNQNKEYIDNYLLIWKYTTQNKPYDSILDVPFKTLMNWGTPYVVTSSYETLKNKGMEIVENDSLRKMIVTFYENNFQELKDDYNEGETNLHNTIQPYYIEHIRSDIYKRNKAKPNNFEALKKNDGFLNILGYLIRVKRYGLIMVEDFDTSVQNLLKALDKELEQQKHD